MNILINKLLFGGRQVHLINKICLMEVKVGLQTQIPLFPIAHKKNVSVLLRVCVCLTENFILYAFTAAADLKDLTAFIMMVNKSKVFEEKGSL